MEQDIELQEGSHWLFKEWATLLSGYKQPNHFRPQDYRVLLFFQE